MRSRRRAPRRWLLAALAGLSLGAVCEPRAIRVVNRPPDPVLVDETGAIDPDGLDALVEAVERERGLGFIQRPWLELVAPDDARIPALLAEARAMEACPGSGVAAAPADAGGRCFADPGFERIVCVAPPDLEEARRALRRQLDAQRYPSLARAAERRAGDPGVALRALLAASARGAMARAGVAGPDVLDLLALPSIDVERREDAAEGCVEIAAHFLSAQEDREAPFRRPPLSTKELISPKRYRAGERPWLLLGAPPQIAGCVAVADESVGLARLLVALLAKGGSVSGPLLAAWQGDRGVRFACEDARAPWLYVAELKGADSAAAFAREIGRLLPPEFAGPSEAYASARRVVAASGIDPAAARAWASALSARELVGFGSVK